MRDANWWAKVAAGRDAMSTDEVEDLFFGEYNRNGSRVEVQMPGEKRSFDIGLVDS